MFWITTLSPTFLNELLDLPRKVSKRVSNKIKILETDPYSAEGDAKKLQDRDNIYRVRVGDYRIFYTIGENVVKVLTVRKRDDQTYRNPQDSNDPLPTAQIPDPDALTVAIPREFPTISPVESEPEPIPTGTSLPRRFTQELLQQWHIPQAYWAQLQPIQTEEALLNSPLPEKYLNRILDNLFPRTIEEIEAQPSLVLPNSTDLDKFIEGDITDFLLKLDPDQEKLKDFGTGGPVLVKGGPGTGKSTLALYQKGFSWTKIHQDLKVTGRTLLLKRNYRNTQEIALACEQILANSEAGDPDCVNQTPSKYHGDRPQLLPFRLPHPETKAIKNFLHRAAKKHRLPITSTAILCPTNQIGRAYAKQVSNEGLPAQFVSGQDIDLKAPYIKVLTLHSAKGLEFPFVVIALARSTFPEMLPYVLPEEEQNDYLNTQRRLLYVGCSRAMRSLLVTLPQGAAYFFENLRPPTWETI